MWLGQQLNPEAPLYNMIQTFTINGAVEVDAFKRAFQSVVDSCDALRTIVQTRDGVPHQTVLSEVAADVEWVDFSGTPDPEGAYSSWLENRKIRLLGLSERLFDTALLKLGEQHYVWYLCQHHLITDGQSFAVVFSLMTKRYRMAIAGEGIEASPVPSYSDYIAYEKAHRGTDPWHAANEHWRSKIAEEYESLNFYGARQTHTDDRTQRVSFHLDAAKSSRLREIALTDYFASLSTNMSLYSLWLTLILVTIHRVTGEKNIRLGTPFQARPTLEFRETVGLFIEIGVISQKIIDGDSFVSLYEQIMGQTFDGLRFAQPGISTAELNRSYEVLVNYVTASFDEFAGMPVDTDWVHTGHGDSHHALRVQICDFDNTGRFTIFLDLNEVIFSESARSWIASQLNAVVDAFIEDPQRTLGSFDLTNDQERQRYLVEFNATQSQTDDRTVIAQFEHRVLADPDAVAAQQGDQQLTYDTLNSQANQFAALLIASGVRPGDRIALCMQRSFNALIGIWGVLKSGAAFTPIDPANPVRRRLELIENLEATLILIDDDEFAPGDGYEDRTINLASIDLQAYPADNPQVVSEGIDLAYLIYTSGSTGKPKAAMLSHEGLANYVGWARKTYGDGQPLNFPLYSALTFDLTLTSIFVPALSGGAIRIYSERDHAPGQGVIAVFDDDLVDIVKLTPAHLELLRSHGITCTRIRKLIVGGEDFKAPLARSIHDAFKGRVEIYNEYGPTEATIGCMVHRYDPQTDVGSSVPIGSPAANTYIYLRDDYNQPVPSGVIGEMVIAGPGVGVGYLGQPELTSARFAIETHPPFLRTYRTGDLARWDEQGRLQFLGRADDQVKVRGARVELGEIEAALTRFPDISAAAVSIFTPSVIKDAGVLCVECGLSSNYPGAHLDDDGVCSDCRDYRQFKDDVAPYFRSSDDLKSMMTDIRNRAVDQSYDCIVLTSGGKDSTYMLYQMVRNFGARPLVFTLDNGYLAEAALDNVRNACSDLGIDLEIGRTEHMGEIFADSLRRHSNVCDGCFKTIYTLSMALARRLGIGTIVTGLSRGQLFETRLADTFRARQFDPEKIDELTTDARKAYHQINDTAYELIGSDLFDDGSIFDEVSFIDFYRYNDVGLDVVYDYLQKETAWQRPPDTGRSTNCLINDVGIYVHKKVRGYHNYALPYSWDVRLGHKVREVALDELNDVIDEDRVKHMMQEIGFVEPTSTERSDRHLVGYFVADQSVAYQELHDFLATSLPGYMVPTRLVQLDALPLTTGGKVDRQALPNPDSVRPDLNTRYVEPKTPLEHQLVSIWRSIMEISQIGTHDDFFELGCDSVTSIRIAAEAKRQGLNITPLQLFTYPTITSLAKELINRQQTAETRGQEFTNDLNEEEIELLRSSMDPEDFAALEEIYPLTPVQSGLLYHTLATPELGLYTGQVACLLDGILDLSKMKLAWDQTIARHSVLRSRFFWEGLDRPLQAVVRSVHPTWDVHDWRSLDESTKVSRLDQLERSLIEGQFDLNAGPLMRFTLVRISDQRHRFIWNIHHIVLDGWSTYPIFSEWRQNYESLMTGNTVTREAPPRFSHFVHWRATQDNDEAREFWRGQLEGFREPTGLPNDSATLEPSGRSGKYELGFTSEQSDSLRALARKLRVTLNCVFQSAWAILLARYGSRDDVLFGTTVSGRQGNIADSERMIGLFINTVPVRLRANPKSSVSAWLPEVQQTLLAIGEFELSALSEIQKVSEVPPDQALFDSIVVFENYPVRIDEQQGSLTIGSLDFTAPSHYPFAVLVYPDAEFKCSMIFDEAKFNETSVARLSGHFRSILLAMSSDPNRIIQDLPLLTKDERISLLREWNPPLLPVDPALPLHQIRDVALGAPEAIAIGCGHEQMTYGELESHSNRLARYLRAKGVSPGDLVGIEAERCIDAIVGILAISKARAAFVPLDPHYPATRLQDIIDDASIGLVVGSGDTKLPTVRGVTFVDASGPDIQNHADSVIDLPLPSDLVYVLYTSGSTGKPKGVMISHSNLAHSTNTRITHYPGQVDKFLLLPSFAFDSSMAGLFWSLCSGGSLILPKAEQHQNMAELVELIRLQQVTHLLTLPSVYDSLLEAADMQLETLRIAIVAGESCHAALFASHKTQCPNATLYNEYGPTEATVWSHCYQFPPDFDSNTVPIGSSVAHVKHFVLDPLRRPVPIGVPGELVIGGPGISRGYLNQEHLTREKFVHLPEVLGVKDIEFFYLTGDLVQWMEDGSLRFLGRIDQQIKIRGMRVEPGEVEAALLYSPEITAAYATLMNVDGRSVPRLIAWYVTTQPRAEAELRARLHDQLPDYMVPSSLIHVNEIPKLPNGKVDSIILMSQHPPFAQAKVPYRGPESSVQEQLLSLWTAVLGLDRIGIDDQFLDLGGDSITALKLSARAHRLGLVFNPKMVMDNPTISQLSQSIIKSDPVDEALAETHEKFALSGLSTDELDELLDSSEE